MGSIGWGGVWSVSHGQRVRGRDDTHMGQSGGKARVTRKPLWGKKGYIYMAHS